MKKQQAIPARVARSPRRVASRGTGEVTKVEPDEGYGFLIDEQGTERFFHATMLDVGLRLEDIRVGTRVSFRPMMSSKGARAVEVRVEQPR